MNNTYQFLSRMAIITIATLLTACAGYSGSNLKPGIATLPEVIASMGEPAMRWKEADGREQLAYPRGPEGTQTFMAYVGADGRLERIEGVLDMTHVGLIQPGKSDKEDVLRILGPSYPYWTTYSKARNELVWEWRYCDTWGKVAFIDVYFDAMTSIVRTANQRPDYRFMFSKMEQAPCSH